MTMEGNYDDPWIPLMTSDNRPADWVKLSDYRHLAYFNLVLCVGVILQNFIVISGYYPERKKLIPLLFLLIASADMVIAVGELLRIVLVFTCPHKLEIKDSGALLPALVSLVPSISILGWTLSTFYNVLLTVYRTATIADPFSAGALRLPLLATVIVGTALWFSVQFSAIISFFFKYDRAAYAEHFLTVCGLLRMRLSLPDLIEYLLVAVKFFNPDTLNHFVMNVGAPIQVAIQGIPSVITLVCIPVQIYFLRKSIRTSEVAANLFKESHKMTVTIILINILDVLSDVFCILNYAIHAAGAEKLHEYRALVILAVSTLPLLNAFGFQLIMILRNKSMKEKYLSFILLPYRGLCRSVNWAHDWAYSKVQFSFTSFSA